ncbi:hypothetical protein NH340_JMT04167 [Sarcoptes scabiei]|uniref:DNA methyltransferase 1-associated protein 1 n=1 Tax=Sarcoptes scabiei TaxID=52283 RepID=A0A132A4S6_SARSC|nr:DNA methyltransferase 1-associated protein 1-like protein [Sarcoptes scabiei]UXI18224.1 hypothetical protein NH340_JMT04167 [Sarcoptes scabiei]
MSDIHDILEVVRDSEKKQSSSLKKKSLNDQHSLKKVKGLNREVYALLCSENKDSASLITSDFSISSKFGLSSFGYKKIKANLSLRKVIKWSWVPFINPARKDGFQLYHWRRESDHKEYPFARMNLIVNVPSYSDDEYREHLQSNEWTKNETDYLFSMCRKFDLRFIVIHDRWDSSSYKERTIENLKDRYYSVTDILARNRLDSSSVTSGGNGLKQGYVFDAEHERKRKEQLKKLYNRTAAEIDEEEQLNAELRKIEQRKKEREKKTQDLQKLITAADSTDRRQEQQNQSRTSTNILANRSARKKATQLRTSKVIDPGLASINTATIESAGIKFPEPKTCGVSLRSSRMKLPSSVGQKRIKAIDQLLQELKLDPHPMATEEVCKHFNDLRSDMVLLYELKMALTNLDFDIQSLEHQLEATNSSTIENDRSQIPKTPLSAVSLPENLTNAFGSKLNSDKESPSNTAGNAFSTTVPVLNNPNISPMNDPSISKKISEIFDVTNSTPRRKAAMEQANLLKKLKKN